MKDVIYQRLFTLPFVTVALMSIFMGLATVAISADTSNANEKKRTVLATTEHLEKLHTTIKGEISSSCKVQSVNGKTGAVVLSAADVGVGLTNGVITIDGEEIEPLTSFAEADPHVGLTNGTIYVHGKTVTPLTAHQSLADYATTEDVNAKVAAQGEYTTGVSNKLETAIADEASSRSTADASLSSYVTGVSNKVVAAQSAADAASSAVAQEAKDRATSIAAETKERLANFKSASDAIATNKQSIQANANAIETTKSGLSDVRDDAAQAISDAANAQSAIDKHKADTANPHNVTAAQVGALTAETDPSTALTNDVAWVRGKKVVSEESDPTVPSWAKAEKKPSYSASEVANLDPQGVFTSPGKMNEMVIVSDGSQTAAIRPGGISVKASKEKDAGILLWPNVSGDALTLATTSDILSKISATDETFFNAVLQVGIGTLGITTNDLQVVHDLAELPVGTSITTVGGLLAALAAALAALKKSVSTLSAKVDDANAALEEVA